MFKKILDIFFKDHDAFEIFMGFWFYFMVLAVFVFSILAAIGWEPKH